jgi:hypothetical protein
MLLVRRIDMKRLRHVLALELMLVKPEPREMPLILSFSVCRLPFPLTTGLYLLADHQPHVQRHRDQLDAPHNLILHPSRRVSSVTFTVSILPNTVLTAITVRFSVPLLVVSFCV